MLPFYKTATWKKLKRNSSWKVPDSQGEINEELLKQVEEIGKEVDIIKQMLDKFTQINLNNAVLFENLQKITKIQQEHLRLIDEVLIANRKGDNDET